jgi:hypothetical protein
VDGKQKAVVSAQKKQDDRVKEYDQTIVFWKNLKVEAGLLSQSPNANTVAFSGRLSLLCDGSIQVMKDLKVEGQNIVEIVRTLFGLELFFLFVLCGSTAAIGAALFHWQKPRKTAYLLTLAWLATFLFPYLVSFIPFRLTLAKSDIWNTASTIADQAAALTAELRNSINSTDVSLIRAINPQAELLLEGAPPTTRDLAEKISYVAKNVLDPMSDVIRGAPFAVMMFVRTGPPSLSLLPSLLTAAITFKALFPVSTAASAILVFGIPIFSTPLTIALFAMLMQLLPSPLLVVAAGLLAVSLLPLMMKPGQYLMSMTTKGFEAAIQLRMRASLLMKVMAGVFILAWLIVVGASAPNSAVELDGLSMANAILGILRGMLVTEPFWANCMMMTAALIHKFLVLVRREGKADEAESTCNKMCDMLGLALPPPADVAHDASSDLGPKSVIVEEKQVDAPEVVDSQP